MTPASRTFLAETLRMRRFEKALSLEMRNLTPLDRPSVFCNNETPSIITFWQFWTKRPAPSDALFMMITSRIVSPSQLWIVIAAPLPL